LAASSELPWKNAAGGGGDAAGVTTMRTMGAFRVAVLLVAVLRCCTRLVLIVVALAVPRVAFSECVWSMSIECGEAL
jgi:hypothetical protein